MLQISLELKVGMYIPLNNNDKLELENIQKWTFYYSLSLTESWTLYGLFHCRETFLFSVQAHRGWLNTVHHRTPPSSWESTYLCYRGCKDVPDSRWISERNHDVLVLEPLEWPSNAPWAGVGEWLHVLPMAELPVRSWRTTEPTERFTVKRRQLQVVDVKRGKTFLWQPDTSNLTKRETSASTEMCDVTLIGCIPIETTLTS